MSLKIGITGGIGSGKSVVSRLLHQMGVPVYYSDAESKRLTSSDAGIKSALCELLGDEVYKDGILNKPFLASYLFASADNAKRIESIIHPVVKKDFIDWCIRNQQHPIVATESAILIESGFNSIVDKIILVTAPEDIRVIRAMNRDKATEVQVRARISAQMPDAAKEKYADYIIINDGVKPLIPQVLDIFNDCLKAASKI